MADLKTRAFDPAEAVLEILTLVASGAHNEEIRRSLARMFVEMTDEEITTFYGESWTSEQVREEFEIESFLTPFVFATRRSTGERGMLSFRHAPRLYFNWDEDETLAKLFADILA